MQTEWQNNVVPGKGESDMGVYAVFPDLSV